MYLSHSSTETEVPPPGTFVSLCPYRKSASANCSASVMTFTISSRQDAQYCRTENFDHCPVFLAKVLRNT
jgi:hypothetical protein